MTRGKYARRADTRAESTAAERVTQLEEQLAEEKRRAAEVEAAVRAELRAADARLLSDVAAIADARVLEVREECRAKIEQERNSYTARVTAASNILARHDVRIPGSSWADFADALCVPLHVVLGDAAENRNARRARSGIARVREDMKVAGRP